MYSTTGWARRRVFTVLLNVGAASRARRGVLLSRSIASLSEPCSRISRRRSRTVGRASETSGRRARKKGASRGATGLVSSTRAVRSVRVDRRLTKDVLALRRVAGNCWSVWESEARSAAIARAVLLVLVISPARSLRRWAIVLMTLEV